MRTDNKASARESKGRLRPTHNSPLIQARLSLLALLLLAGVGPILVGTIWPSVVRQEPSVFYSSEPRDIPAISFRDAQGRTVNLSDFRGRVVLLNVWATWCEPCREEMPALDRLQGKLGDTDFEVVALSVDRAGMNAVEGFFKAIGIRQLKRYIDESAATVQRLGIVGLPTTLLIDSNGREVRRYVGPAEWDREDLVQVIRNTMARQRR